MNRSLDTIRVMIVDDSRSMRRIVRRFLENGGAEGILEATDGKEALELLGSEGVELVVSDLNMPRMNGLELLQAVRAREAAKGDGPGICFVMLTVEAVQKTMNQALEMGADSYIVKPVTETIFMGEIGAALERSRSGDDS